MRGRRTALVIAVILGSSSAIASTELYAGPNFAGSISREAMESSGRDGSVTLDALPDRYSIDPSAVDGSAAGDAPFVVNDRLFERQSEPAPAAPVYDPFNWVALLIAFAGLTAVFAGKRSGGRGLIAA
jgi:hypothetical protein